MSPERKKTHHGNNKGIFKEIIWSEILRSLSKENSFHVILVHLASAALTKNNGGTVSLLGIFILYFSRFFFPLKMFRIRVRKRERVGIGKGNS